MSIVIANSVGIDNNGKFIIHSPSRWSEGVSREENWFAYYPWELAYLSSLLKRELDDDVRFVDGCLELLTVDAYVERIIAHKPSWLIMESATRVFNENCAVALRVKKACDAKLVFVGQHATAFPEDVLRAGIDYVCIGEYEFTVLELLQGKDPAQVFGLYPNDRRALLDVNQLPWPEDNDVSRLAYGRPGEPSSDHLEIQAYAARGCPRSCTFCVARNLYYACPNWRPRAVDDVVAEIAHLKEKYPAMQGIFFDEEEHNADKNFILNLTQAIKNAGLDHLHYEAMCDIRAFDHEMLEAMKSAGYYQIRFGIESASDKVQKSINKHIDIAHVERVLRQAKKLDIKTYGTFMMGAPGSTPEEDMKTIELIRRFIDEALLGRAQISVCTPQPATPFYEQAVKDGYITTDEYTYYDGGSTPIVSYPGYSNEEISVSLQKALRMRDRRQFIRKIKHIPSLAEWVSLTYRKHGVQRALLKTIRRLQKELFL